MVVVAEVAATVMAAVGAAVIAATVVAIVVAATVVAIVIAVIVVATMIAIVVGAAVVLQTRGLDVITATVVNCDMMGLMTTMMDAIVATEASVPMRATCYIEASTMIVAAVSATIGMENDWM